MLELTFILHVQAQAQTIDILVSEKSSLQAELGSLRTQLANRASKMLSI